MADQDETGSRKSTSPASAGRRSAAALGAIPGAGQFAAHAQGAFDWKKFKGEKIEVFLVKSPRGDLLTKYHKEFEDMTGITVGSEMIPEQQQRQKAVIEFNSGNPSFDVIAISYHVQKRLFGKNKWMEDVRPLVADKSITDPNLDFADFAKGGMAWATQPDGRVDSLPFNIDPWMLYYNKELFDAKSIAYPKSFRRDRRRRGASSTILPRASAASSGAASRMPTCRSGRASCWATAADSSTTRASSLTETQAAIDARRCTRRCSRSTGRKASPASTGTRRRASSCRGRPRCGSTASASRSRSRIRPSRASSARSATA